MAASSDKTRNSAESSKQLLYSEQFGGTLEDKLRFKKANEERPKKILLPPPSSVLSRVQAFLPQLAAANQELFSKPEDEVNIENISDDYDGPLVEMSLALVPDFSSGSDDDSTSDESDDSGDDVQNENEAKKTPSLTAELQLPTSKRHDRKLKIVCLSASGKDGEKEDGGGT